MLSRRRERRLRQNEPQCPSPGFSPHEFRWRWGALKATGKALLEQKIAVSGSVMRKELLQPQVILARRRPSQDSLARSEQGRRRQDGFTPPC